MGLKNTKNRLEKKLDDNTPLTQEELERFGEIIEELQRKEHENVRQNPLEYIVIFLFVFSISSGLLSVFWNVVMTRIFKELPMFTFIQAAMVTVFIFLFMTLASRFVGWINDKLRQFLLGD